jgi:O-antigen ligase
VWTSTLLEPTNTMDKLIGFEAGHAHEAYLELWLELGLVGVVLYVGLFFSAMRAAWRRLGDQKDIATWALLCGASQFVISLSETPAFGIWVVLLGAMHMMSMRRYDVPGGYGVIETNWRVNPVGGAGVNRAR